VKILVAQHFGTCFGVRDAVAQAKQFAAQAPLTILGELVHTPSCAKSFAPTARLKDRSTNRKRIRDAS
jgi:4-hydroxy-3-methylbut-2-enyl diphosphate reductase IspH